jgi:hypothetical protein
VVRPRSPIAPPSPTTASTWRRFFEGGAKSFIFKRTNGRWRDVLTPDELASYAARVAEVLPPAAAVWLERGRRAVDPRVS